MPLGVKHVGRRKAKNPHFKHASFAIWMCDYCDEPLQDYDGGEPVMYKSRSYHLTCFDAARKDGTIK